jgi:hypothetical protein
MRVVSTSGCYHFSVITAPRSFINSREVKELLAVSARVRWFRLQSRGLISFEVRIVSAEEQAFQALGVSQDRIRHPLPLRAEELPQPFDRVDDVSVN